MHGEPQYSCCVCSENHLRFYYCCCGARQSALEAQAKILMDDLSSDQENAMVALPGAIEQRTANRLGYSLKKMGLSTGWSRSGDNAIILTDLGKILQKMLLDYRDIMCRMSS